MEQSDKIAAFLRMMPKLDEVGDREFARIVEHLGSVDDLEFTAIWEYALAFSDVIRLQKEVTAEGEVIESAKNGSLYCNPKISILFNRRNALTRLRDKLMKARVAKSAKAGNLFDLVKN